MRHILRGALAASLAALALWPASARAETLADAFAFGYEASGLIEQNRAVLRAADEQVAQAVAALRAVVNWSADFQASYPGVSAPTGGRVATYTLGEFDLGATLGLSTSLLVYDGGASRLAVDAQKELVLATREQLMDVEQQVLLRIVQAYTQVRRVSEFVSLRESNVRLITQELQAAQDRFEVGEVTRTDVALAQSSLAAAQSLLAAEQGNLVQAIEEFRAAVGRSPGNLEPPPSARIIQSVEEARAIAQRTNPTIRQGQHEVAAAEISIARARASLRPSVSVTGQVGVDQDFEESLGAGLSVSGPVYQGGSLASVLREVTANRDASRAQLIETARRVDQNVGNAYATLEVARASRGAFEEQVRAANIAFEGVREEAALGARTTLDVLDAEQDLLDARTSLVSAEVDEMLATYQILSAIGLLTVQNLGLRVQVYDPSAYYNLVDDAPAAFSDQGRALDRVLQAIGD